MNAKLIVSQVILVLIVVIVFLVYKEYSHPKENELASLSAKIEEYDTLGKAYLEKKLPNVVHMSHALNQGFFKEINKTELKAPILLIRFAEVHCSSCMVRDINLLKDYIPKESWSNILMIASYENEDYFKLFARIHDLEDKNIKRVDSHFLEVDKQLTDAPYYMILDENLKIQEFFISSKYSDERTEDFFKNLFSNYKI